MARNKTIYNRIYKKLARESFDLYKKIYHLINHKDDSNQSVLFIMGCQRSGTTLLTKLFNADLNVSVYGEFSKLSSDDKKDNIRLNSANSVNRILNNDKASFVVAKPLVESQNAIKLLESLPEMKVLWMYRNYRDVASSNLKRFGEQNGINNIKYIIENDQTNWRSEHLRDEIKKVLNKYYSESMNPHDAGALFWYVRNSLYFDQGLDTEPRVMICDYQDLVEMPEQTMGEIYKFSEKTFSGKRNKLKSVHQNSLRKGQSINLNPEIDDLCSKLLRKMDEVYKSQRASQKNALVE